MWFLFALVVTRGTAYTKPSSFADVKSINPKVVEAKYAVRGKILLRALALKQQLKENPDSLPFDKVIHCNIGNPQAVGQSPITFYRDVLSAVLKPGILDSEEMHGVWDVGRRVQTILKGTGSRSIGAYTHSQGLRTVRDSVAEFIERRDGFKSDPERIFLTNGASAAARLMMATLVWKARHGVMIPIPQYPLYTALMTLNGGTTVPYYLNERQNWGIGAGGVALEDAYHKAVSAGVEVRAIVVINPGNPTGQTLTRDDLDIVIKFAAKHNLVIFADEVYQANVYDPKQSFTSFKKALMSMIAKNKDNERGAELSKVPLISFHSTSKGLMGECGLRGGYMELVHFPDDTYAQLYKFASIELCSNTIGQVATELMVNPPKKDEPSYKLFIAETTELYQELKRKAAMTQEALRNTPHMSVSDLSGAMYAFPTIEIPDGAIKAAEAAGVKPDAFYCVKLLESTGIVTVPGSGFRQREGSFHFRMTFLPPEAEIVKIASAIKDFHQQFWEKYGSPKEKESL